MSTDRFRAAIAAFDAENALDPNQDVIDGGARPHELVQAERLSAWVERLEPSASEALRLAARCQHIRRWAIARSGYPAGRLGYLQWRKELGRMHADVAASILERVGYDAATIEAVRRINTKQGLKTNPDTQTMEDALCLAFLAHEAEDFAGKHPADKVIDILRKTWKKMSPRGRATALDAELPDAVRRLVEQASAAPGAESDTGTDDDDAE